MAFLLALGLTLYPVISNYVNQKYASQIHTAYQEVMEQADDSELLKAKELADTYNHTLVPGATAAYSQEGLQAASQDYVSPLDVAGNGIMGCVDIPKAVPAQSQTPKTKRTGDLKCDKPAYCRKFLPL